MARILLIDDDEDLTHYLQPALEEHGYQVHCLERAERGPEMLAQGGFDLVLLDNRMPGMSGIEFLAALRQRGLSVPVILMTGHTSADLAIEAWKLKASAYVAKPLDFDKLSGELLGQIRAALKTARVIKEPIHIPQEGDPGGSATAVLLGASEPMLEVYKLIGQWADGSDPVLVLGETGTGKELVARALFQHSSRADRPFVAINSAALHEGTLESELFGHEKGAFSGAEGRYAGKFEQAHGGTILLDEIGDMGLATQAKILRVLQEHQITRMRGSESVPVDFRVIACTHRNLEAAMSQGTFRKDLYHRLNDVVIRLPPLRERGTDVQLLADQFIAREAERLGQPPPLLHEKARARLQQYEWPGNVRELQKVIRRAVRACRGPQILAENLGLPVQEEDGEATVVSHLRAAVRAALASGQGELDAQLGRLLERELLQLTCREANGNESEVARRLGLARNTVRARMQTHGLK
jgi:DNA-binding NtrC family response regulator